MTTTVEVSKVAKVTGQRSTESPRCSNLSLDLEAGRKLDESECENHHCVKNNLDQVTKMINDKHDTLTLTRSISEDDHESDSVSSCANNVMSPGLSASNDGQLSNNLKTKHEDLYAVIIKEQDDESLKEDSSDDNSPSIADVRAPDLSLNLTKKPEENKPEESEQNSQSDGSGQQDTISSNSSTSSKVSMNPSFNIRVKHADETINVYEPPVVREEEKSYNNENIVENEPKDQIENDSASAPKSKVSIKKFTGNLLNFAAPDKRRKSVNPTLVIKRNNKRFSRVNSFNIASEQLENTNKDCSSAAGITGGKEESKRCNIRRQSTLDQLKRHPNSFTKAPSNLTPNIRKPRASTSGTALNNRVSVMVLKDMVDKNAERMQSIIMFSPTLNRNENNAEAINKLTSNLRDSFKKQIQETRAKRDKNSESNSGDRGNYQESNSELNTDNDLIREVDAESSSNSFAPSETEVKKIQKPNRAPQRGNKELSSPSKTSRFKSALEMLK